MLVLRHWPLLYILLVTAALFAAFRHWAYDDPFITYRYAENLYNGLGMVYNPGERVLSTTTPLFALILAGVRFVWADLPRAANLISALSLATGGWLLWDLARTLEAPAVGWTGLLLYPTFPLLASTFGSETPLYLALCLAAFALYARQRYAWSAFLLGWAVLARGDAALVAALLGADYLIRERRLLPVRAGMAFLGVLLPWVVFAWLYFGDPLPVTLAAKRAQGLMDISTGFAPGLWQMLLGYARLRIYWVEAALLLLGMGWACWRARRWLVLVLWPLVYTLAYTLLGVARYFWYYAPLVPGMIAAVGLGLELIGNRKVRSVNSHPSTPGLLRSPSAQGAIRHSLFTILLLLILAAFQITHLARLRAAPDERYPAYRAVGEWLAENTPPDASIGALEVGMIGYFARPRPMVDFAGLIQPQVASLFAPQTTYQDAARWAIDAYQPDYLVLHDNFQQVANSARQACRIVAEFPGRQYAYSRDLIVYDCR